MIKVFRVINFLLCVIFCYYVVSPAGTWMPTNPSWSILGICSLVAMTTAWIDSKIKNSGPKDPGRMA